MRGPDEVLDDSEASLRLVDQAIDELSASIAELDRERRELLERVVAQPGCLAELSRALLHAYEETVGIVQRIRATCATVDPHGPGALQQLHSRLREVASAAESASNHILSAVARANAVVEGLTVATDAARPQMLASLRDELQATASRLHARASAPPCNQSPSK